MKFNNVMETYLSMFDCSAHAIQHLCQATNRKYNKRYLAEWPTSKVKMPLDCVSYMQGYVFRYAIDVLELPLSAHQAMSIYKALSVPEPKSD